MPFQDLGLSDEILQVLQNKLSRTVSIQEQAIPQFIGIFRCGENGFGQNGVLAVILEIFQQKKSWTEEAFGVGSCSQRGILNK
jgi:hypothetical protein